MAGVVRLTADVKVNEQAINATARRLKGAVSKVARHRLSVGLHEDEGTGSKKDYNDSASNMSLAEVAAIHEFGGGSMPDRSWLRTWFDENEGRLRKEMTEVMRDEYNGDDEAVARRGAVWAKQLQDWIQLEQGGLQQLAASTVDRKTSAGLRDPDVPLLATGQLVKSIKAMLDGAEA